MQEDSAPGSGGSSPCHGASPPLAPPPRPLATATAVQGLRAARGAAVWAVSASYLPSFDEATDVLVISSAARALGGAGGVGRGRRRRGQALLQTSLGLSEPLSELGDELLPDNPFALWRAPGGRLLHAASDDDAQQVRARGPARAGCCRGSGVATPCSGRRDAQHSTRACASASITLARASAHPSPSPSLVRSSCSSTRRACSCSPGPAGWACTSTPTPWAQRASRRPRSCWRAAAARCTPRRWCPTARCGGLLHAALGWAGLAWRSAVPPLLTSLTRRTPAPRPPSPGQPGHHRPRAARAAGPPAAGARHARHLRCGRRGRGRGRRVGGPRAAAGLCLLRPRAPPVQRRARRRAAPDGGRSAPPRGDGGRVRQRRDRPGRAGGRVRLAGRRRRRDRRRQAPAGAVGDAAAGVHERVCGRWLRAVGRRPRRLILACSNPSRPHTAVNLAAGKGRVFSSWAGAMAVDGPSAGRGKKWGVRGAGSEVMRRVDERMRRWREGRSRCSIGRHPAGGRMRR
jgi:hypothetical protein